MTPYANKRIGLLLLFLAVFLSVSAQENYFLSVNVEPELIESGKYNNFYKYDLGKYLLFVGRYENNLRYKIQNKQSNHIDYENKDSMSDAMIRIPKFFFNEDKSILIILMEEAAEYSWGQEVIMIRNGVVRNIGYLSYAVLGEEYEESLADHCRIKGNKDRIWMTFEDIKIIDYSNDNSIIEGRDLRFELTMDGINRI